MLLEQSRCVRNNVGLVEKYAAGLRRGIQDCGQQATAPAGDVDDCPVAAEVVARDDRWDRDLGYAGHRVVEPVVAFLLLRQALVNRLIAQFGNNSPAAVNNQCPTAPVFAVAGTPDASAPAPPLVPSLPSLHTRL